MARKNSRRILFTPSPEAFRLLDELHELTGTARAAIVSELLDTILPVIRDMAESFRQLAETPDKARELVADYIAEGHRQLTQTAIDFDRTTDGRTVRGKRQRARTPK